VRARSSIWYGAVLRGDVNAIKVGASTNIQDGAIIHVAKHNVSGKARPTVIGGARCVAPAHSSPPRPAASAGRSQTICSRAILHATTPCPAPPADRVTVGHGAILHACTIEDGAFVGMVRGNLTCVF
jgi:carbonic anhydrase/acetyltransferase-like protein (isoleucine patch superfamily)